MVSLSSISAAQEKKTNVLNFHRNQRIIEKDIRIVNSQRFKIADESEYCSPSIGDNLNLYFLDLDNNKSNVEQIEIIDDDTWSYYLDLYASERLDLYKFHEIDGVVKSINECNYVVMGEDGKSIGTWSFSYVSLSPRYEGGYFILRPDIVKSIKEFALSNRNNGAVTIKTINRNAIIRRNTFNTFGKLSSWIQETQKKEYNFGTFLKNVNWKSDMGEYTIELYSSDGNDSDCETIIIKRSDGLKCKLDGIREYKATIYSPDFYKGEYVELGCIDVSWPGVGKFTILDSDVYATFREIKKTYPNVGKAFYVEKKDESLLLTKNSGDFMVD